MARTAELQHLRRGFWRGVREGLSTVAAARRVGVSADRGFRWFRECGGVSPVGLAEPIGRYLSLSEREEISRGLAAEMSLRAIARHLGRNVATIVARLIRTLPLGSST